MFNFNRNPFQQQFNNPMMLQNPSMMQRPGQLPMQNRPMPPTGMQGPGMQPPGIVGPQGSFGNYQQVRPPFQQQPMQQPMPPMQNGNPRNIGAQQMPDFFNSYVMNQLRGSPWSK